MKVLLSAYACEPDKGSEPGVGWHWAIEIARLGHEVHVITRANNSTAIKAAIFAGDLPANLVFHYCDLSPRWITVTKHWLRSPYLYYYFWQRRATDLAKRIHGQLRFDMIHHITFGSIRLPSFMGELGIPFTIGPIGGGESAPRGLRKHFPLRGKIIDTVRDASNWLIRLDPLMNRTFLSADRILLKTPDSLWCIPVRYRGKCSCTLEIGIDAVGPNPPELGDRQDDLVRVLFVGRHLYWKGMWLGLQAFARAYHNDPRLRLTMVGEGPETPEWKRLASGLGIADVVDWRGWLPQADVMRVYAEHELFLFPSLHDSSGNVILEAASQGLQIICLNLGGPGMIVETECGVKVPAHGRSESEVITSIAEALLDHARILPEKRRLERLRWLSHRSWHAVVRLTYDSRDATWDEAN